MALNKANATAATFEAEDALDDAGTGTVSAETVKADTADAAPADEPVKTTALATQGQRALTTASAVMKTNVISGLKDAFRVEFDSLPAIGASLGTFVRKADETDLGPELKLQLRPEEKGSPVRRLRSTAVTRMQTSLPLKLG